MKDALIPETYDEFRSVEFWDGFFESRGKKAFEWYGDWRQLKSFFARDCTPGREVLVVGCGNSELSAEMYDHGCEAITNLDFSKPVIASMMRRNLRLRPKMRWKVGDMTDLKYPDASFDIVVDKGGLDALMGEESEESTAIGKTFLSGVSRVIAPQGVYLCVTLAQAQVLTLLLEHFKQGWLVELHAVPPSPDMARSALQPYFVRAEKIAPGQMPGRSNICSIARNPTAPNAEQLDEICQILEAAASRAVQEVSKAENGDAQLAGFDQLSPGQRRTVALPQRPEGEPDVKPPRFWATVLDVGGSAADAAVQTCCVFLVPQGRESEWLFASEEGQWQVAGQCSCRRVILVALNRDHQFSTSAAVQSELSPLVEALAPLDVRGIAGSIPIMTTQEGVGRRRVLAETQSSISGRIVVEDVFTEGGEEASFARRMVFVDNSNLIQSEACLKPSRSSAKSSKLSQKESKKKSAKSAASEAADSPQLELDHSILAMDYHKQIIAGILSSECCRGRRDLRGASCLVVGLGGGGLPVFLQRHLQLSTRVVELDPEVAKLAKEHFGCHESPGLLVEVNDGLHVINEVEPESLDVMIVDAGSNDASLAISCPPAPFLAQEFLEKALQVLRPQGLLVVNCVTRSDSAFQDALKSMQAVFPMVKYSEVEEDVNRILFAAKTDMLRQKLSKKFAQTCIDGLSEQLSSDQISMLVGEISCLELRS